MSKLLKHCSAALVLAGAFAFNASANDATGAGASFVYPAMSKWSSDYAKATGSSEEAWAQNRRGDILYSGEY